MVIGERKPPQGNILQRAQEAKGDLLSEGGEVVMPINMAALAFGIPAAQLRKMSKTGDFLLIQPEGNEVVLCLKPSIVDWRRSLWDKLIDSLERGRTGASASFDAYQKLFTEVQRVRMKYPEGSEVIQVAMGKMVDEYKKLPRGMREKLKGQGMGLEQVLAQGVLGSPADF